MTQTAGRRRWKIKSRTGWKPQRCRGCGQVFAHPGALAGHQRAVSNEGHGISEHERRVMDALVETGHQQGAAGALGISVQTVKNEMYRVRIRTGATGTYDLFFRYGKGEFDE